MFHLSRPQKGVSHPIITWGKFLLLLQGRCVSVPPWGPPAVQQQRPPQNNCSCQHPSPCVTTRESLTHRHTQRQCIRNTSPWKTAETLSGWPDLATVCPCPGQTDRQATLPWSIVHLGCNICSPLEIRRIWTWIVFFQQSPTGNWCNWTSWGKNVATCLWVILVDQGQPDPQSRGHKTYLSARPSMDRLRNSQV